MPRWRVEIVCEDRRSERFLRSLCQRFGVKVMYVYTAPAGRGAASDWVLKQYALHVRRRRSKSHQHFLGLLLQIDGDRAGLHARKEQLARQLEEAGLPGREDSESIALFVPTWSIETWLAFLCGTEGVTETESLKARAPHVDLWRDGDAEAAAISRASQCWPGERPLPSLADSAIEGRRLGLGR